MGKTFENLTPEQLCDLMCGKPEEDYECQSEKSKVDTDGVRVENSTKEKVLRRKPKNKAEQ